MRVSTVFVLAVAILASCGGDDSETAGGPGPIDPATGRPAVVELTDGMMEEYVELSKELHALGKEGNPPMAWLKARGWDWKRWSTVASQVSMAMAHGAMQSVSTHMEGADERLAELEKKRDTASGQEREMIDLQIQMLKTQKASVAERVDSPMMKDPQLRKNYEVIKRWMPKLEAIGDE